MSAGGSSAAIPDIFGSGANSVVGYGGAGDVARVSDTGSAAGWLNNIGLATSGVSSLASIIGGQRQAAADRYNADLAAREAEIVRAQGTAEAAQVQQNARRAIGMAIANAGASGVDPNTGSPVNVVADLAQEGELSRQLAIYRGTMRGISLDSKAGMLRYNAGQASDAGVLTGGATFLTGYAKYVRNKDPVMPTLPTSTY